MALHVQVTRFQPSHMTSVPDRVIEYRGLCLTVKAQGTGYRIDIRYPAAGTPFGESPYSSDKSDLPKLVEQAKAIVDAFIGGHETLFAAEWMNVHKDWMPKPLGKGGGVQDACAAGAEGK